MEDLLSAVQTNSMSLLTLILTSAVVSALVSGVFLMLNDGLRRKSEEKRFKLDAALQLTKMRDEQKGQAGDTDFTDPAHTLISYRNQIERLWNR
jgi:hypothetical protein